VQLLPATVC